MRKILYDLNQFVEEVKERGRGDCLIDIRTEEVESADKTARAIFAQSIIQAQVPSDEGLIIYEVVKVFNRYFPQEQKKVRDLVEQLKNEIKKRLNIEVKAGRWEP